MPRITLDASVKKQFRRKELLRIITKAQEEWLYGVGGTIQVFAQRSMRKAPKPKKRLSLHGEFVPYGPNSKRRGKLFFRKGRYSRPGSPPFRRSGPIGAGNLTKIWFVVIDPTKVIVGPVLLNGSKNMDRTVPNLHEFGGKVTRTYRKRKGNIGLNSRYQGRARTLNYPARPFMNPAGTRGVNWLRRKMRGSIRG